VKAEGNKSLLERILGVVTAVRAGEATTALLMTLNGFVLLMAYSCIKPVREALILEQHGGAQYKVYMAGATAVILSIAIPAYGRFSRNVSRNRLIVYVTLFFTSNLLIFYGVAKTIGSTLPLALGFYLWIAVFNMMIVAQFWAFANDLYSDEAGVRLFPLLGLGASLGAVAGSATARIVIGRVESLTMMPIAAAMLVGSAAITQWVHLREVANAPTKAAQQTAVGPIGGSTGEAFRAVLAQRYLLFIALFSLVFTLVKTNGDYMLSYIVKDTANNAVAAGTLAPHQVEKYIAGFFAGFEFKIDLLSLLVQAFAVSRLVKYLGVRGSFYIMPAVAFLDATVMAVMPVLAAVRIGKTAESSVDYSLNNTVRNMLWLPTSRRAKYLAKQATDSLFVRMGDVMSALLVFVAIRMVGMSVRGFATINVILVGVWFLLARSILRERARIIEEPGIEEGKVGEMAVGG
jgi:AAA family ATP:ADP antiporter